MEYKDIKTADELESWYADKEDILEGHVRDYAVPFGNVYHLDSPGYVSEERWCDTLPSDRERSTFMALQNGVSTKEIIEHKDEIVWDQIGAEYKSIKSDSHRGLSDVKDAKAKQAVHVNDDRKNDAVALDMQEK